MDDAGRARGPLRVVVVDDEPAARRGLKLLLAPHRDVVVAAECGDGRDAVRAIRREAPDLVFLDVRMPELDGFGVVAEVGPAQMPPVVFVTAFDDFAVRAFEVNAVDYLVKPFTDARFEQTLARARSRLRLDAPGPRLGAVLRDAPFVVRLGARSFAVTPAEVDWIEAQDYYAVLHVGGVEHLVRESIRTLEARLDPARFVRVHRSAIVNVASVRDLVRPRLGAWVLRLRDGTELPVSRRRRAALALLWR